MLSNAQKEILDQVFDEGFINNHNNGTRLENTLESVEVGVGLWIRDMDLSSSELIPLYKGTFTCNPFKMGKDGHVHLSTMSCSGAVIGGNIDRYNHEMSQNNLGAHTVEMIVPITKEGYKVLKKHWEWQEYYQDEEN